MLKISPFHLSDEDSKGCTNQHGGSYLNDILFFYFLFLHAKNQFISLQPLLE
jgi:hypothetical protein